MTAVSRATYRQDVSENMGDWLEVTTTSAGASDGTTIVCTALAEEDFGGDDGAFDAFWALVTSGNNDGELRRVARTSGYDASTTTLTVTRAFSNQVASGVTVELHRNDPRVKHAAINRALQHVHPHIHRRITNETLIVDSILLNGDFENTTSGAFDNWSETGSPTVTVETTTVFHGTNSAKVVASGATEGLEQDRTTAINLQEIAGKNITFKMRVWTATASAATIRINFGSATSESDAHDGDSSWRLLNKTVAVPTDATQVVVELRVTAGNTAYFDTGWLEIGPVYEYTVPNAMRTVNHVEQQADEDDPDGPYWKIDHLWPGRILRLRGTGPLSTLSADTDTSEVDEDQQQIISAVATAIAFGMLAAQSAIDDRQRLQQEEAKWMRTGESLLSDPRSRTAPMGAERATRFWYVRDNDVTRTLVFQKHRSGQSVDVF